MREDQQAQRLYFIWVWSGGVISYTINSTLTNITWWNAPSDESIVNVPHRYTESNYKFFQDAVYSSVIFRALLRSSSLPCLLSIGATNIDFTRLLSLIRFHDSAVSQDLWRRRSVRGWCFAQYPRKKHFLLAVHQYFQLDYSRRLSSGQFHNCRTKPASHKRSMIDLGPMSAPLFQHIFRGQLLNLLLLAMFE